MGTPRAVGARAASAVAGVGLVGLTATLTLAGPVQARSIDPRQVGEPLGLGSSPPNIVLILMDDASMDVVASMAQAQEMAARGASYRNAFVVDSLCCVSRTVTHGQYPHQTAC